MEHLLLPNDPAPSVRNVPYVGIDRWDGGPFLTYPARKGMKGILLAPTDGKVIRPDLYGRFCKGLNEQSDPNAPAILEVQHDLSLSSLYDKFLRSDNGETVITTAHLMMLLQSVLEQLNNAFSEYRKQRCDHIARCLEYTKSTISQLHNTDFDPKIKYSICSVGEVLSNLVRRISPSLDIQGSQYMWWSFKSLSGEMKSGMIQAGWCPSDIARVEDHFSSLQTWHMLSRMKRVNPHNDHSGCTEDLCRAYQIDLQKEYKLGHVEGNCKCAEIPGKVQAINNQAVIDILRKENRIPLLKITECGRLEDLSVEIVESEELPSEIGKTAAAPPYVAISHVWAGGLGNPRANSLHLCQLARLRKLASAAGHAAVTPLIWLDTLCCPVEDLDARSVAISRLRQVYSFATHVLVLDDSEKLARIFTSSWLRRLWTLQEGALANSLIFQFADTTISLGQLFMTFIQRADSDLRYFYFGTDMYMEWCRLVPFFHADRYRLPKADLNTLDRSLSHRSVTFASDEALCIGTLMNLSLPIIQSPQTTPCKQESPEFGLAATRMQKVWELLSSSRGGLPASIIFFDSKRLPMPGWRWAPASLLDPRSNIYPPAARQARWQDTKLGTPTKSGLAVKYPGCILRPRKYAEGHRFQLWPGINRLFKSVQYFRYAGTQKWLRISRKEWFGPAGKTPEDYDATPLLPEVIHEDHYAVIMQKEIEERPGEGETSCDGLLAEVVNENQSHEGERGISVERKEDLMVMAVPLKEEALLNALEVLAHQLEHRRGELTKAFPGIHDTNSPEYKAAVKNLKDEIRRLTAEMLEKNPEAAQGAKDIHGDGILPHLWILSANWYYIDIVGTWLPNDQQWFVD